MDSRDGATGVSSIIARENVAASRRGVAHDAAFAVGRTAAGHRWIMDRAHGCLAALVGAYAGDPGVGRRQSDLAQAGGGWRMGEWLCGRTGRWRASRRRCVGRARTELGALDPCWG